MITDHMPAVPVPPDHLAGRMAAAVPACGDVEDRRDLDPAPPGRGPAAAAAAPPEAELGGPGPARGPARRDTQSAPPRAVAAGHPGHRRALAPRHRPVPLENRIRQVTCRSSVRQAACVYSLIRPCTTGFRRICCVSTSVTVARGASRSSSGTCCVMPGAAWQCCSASDIPSERRASRQRAPSAAAYARPPATPRLPRTSPLPAECPKGCRVLRRRPLSPDCAVQHTAEVAAKGAGIASFSVSSAEVADGA
jgi:hypothetical protein